MNYKEKSFWVWYDWIFAVAVNFGFGKGVYCLGEHFSTPVYTYFILYYAQYLGNL
jgi:hypothetical protein